MHIFKYSRRKGTVADRLPGQLTDAVKSKRSDVLLEMTARHSAQYRARYIGKHIEVLAEEYKNGFTIGHTADYVKVYTKGNVSEGSNVTVIAGGLTESGDLSGEIEN